MKLFYKSLIIMLCITIIGVGGFVFWKKGEDAEVSSQEETHQEEPITSAELKELVVETQVITTNLLDRGFIKAKFAIQTDSKETKERLGKLMFQAESIIIKSLAQMSKEKVLGEKGLELLEQTIKDELNNMLEAEDKVVKVYITERMIQ